MKLAVYSIASNEQKFIQRWVESSRDADTIVLADTGSTDDTVAMATEFGVEVYSISVSPWRFDVARNASLTLVPKDIDVCIALDVDEILEEGWRESLESQWIDKVSTRGRYRYVWSHNEDNSDGVVYSGEKIHARQGYRWIHPVHETLMSDRVIENQIFLHDFQITHWPDNAKSRSQYLPLLELAIKETPDDDRNVHYLAREYMFTGQNQRAIESFKRHLQMPKATWKAERASSMRYISRCYRYMKDYDSSLEWARKAAAECPTIRETWIELANVCYYLGRWSECFSAANGALEIKGRELSYISEPESWGPLPWDLAAISAFHLGLDAKFYGEAALKLLPDSDRLKENLKWYNKIDPILENEDASISQEE